MAATRTRAKRTASKATDASTLDKILASLTVLAKRGELLEERLDKLEQQPTSAASPQFVAMKPEDDGQRKYAGTYRPPEALMKRHMKELLTSAGQQISGNRGPLDDPANIAKLPPQYRPVFRSGDMVRINPDAVVWGSNGRPWREVLEKANSDGLGEILAIQYMTKTWEPKYTVQVQGLTRNNGDGFRESELLPA